MWRLWSFNHEQRTLLKLKDISIKPLTIKHLNLLHFNPLNAKPLSLHITIRLNFNCNVSILRVFCNFASKLWYMDPKRILIVDDEETLCEVLRLNLQNEGYDVDIATSAEQALTYDIRRYDLILLDIMMGEISGIQMAKILKSEPATAAIPIIFCTARDSEDDMVRGLDLGADDYIMKPYTVRNVLARVRSVLRRSARQQDEVEKMSENFLQIDGLQLDMDLKQCSVDGEQVKLTKTEFELLAFLMSNPGKIFSRDEIISRVWGDVIVFDRTIDVNITRLRSKIGQYGAYIITRLGFGYGFLG